MKNKMLHVLVVAWLGIGMMLPVRATWANSDTSYLKALTAQWWQWVHSIPYENNPLNDPTGANCMVGQRGSTWFLVGSADGTPVNRTCHIPKAVRLLVPAFNLSVYNSPNVCGQGPDAFSVRDMRALLDPYVDAVSDIQVSLDGRAVPHIRRVKSDVFQVTFPENNFANAVWCSAVGGQPAGIYGPAVDDRYYTLVGPLHSGTHTLKAHAVSPDFGTQDNTYTLIVE